MSDSPPAGVRATLAVDGRPLGRSPRVWLGTSIVLVARFLTAGGYPLAVEGVVFRGIRPDNSPWTAAATAGAPGEWRAVLYLDQAGTWLARVDCALPLPQAEQLSIDAVQSVVLNPPPWPMQLDFSDPRNSGLLFIL